MGTVAFRKLPQDVTSVGSGPCTLSGSLCIYWLYCPPRVAVAMRPIITRHGIKPGTAVPGVA